MRPCFMKNCDVIQTGRFSSSCNRLCHIVANGALFVAKAHERQNIVIARTGSRHSLTHKGIRPVKSGARLCIYNLPAALHSWARVPGNKELEKEKGEDEVCLEEMFLYGVQSILSHRRFHLPVLGLQNVSTTFALYYGIQQPPPSLHRQHYHAAWYPRCVCSVWHTISPNHIAPAAWCMSQDKQCCWVTGES